MSVVITTAFVCGSSAAQQRPAQTAAEAPVGPVSSKSLLASREELQDVLAHLKADSYAALLLKERLEQGDFEVGDRLVVRVEGVTEISDTFTVRDGRSLELPTLQPFSLLGVLRSEVDSVLRAKVQQVYRNPVVHVTPLIRIGLLGAVNRPGFYSMPAQLPLSDAIMIAGGISADAKLEKLTARRLGAAGFTELDGMRIRSGLARGESLDRLNLQGGDELEIGRKTSRSALDYILPISGLVGLLFTLTRL